MEQFLPITHCPTSPVSLCAVGAIFPQVHKSLQCHGIEILSIPANEKLSKPVQYHADLQLGILTNNRIIVGKGESSLRNQLTALGFDVQESSLPLSKQYPQEAMLDFLSLGDVLIGKQSLLQMNNLLNNSQIIAVNQGYTKCNVAVIHPKALITSDPSIVKACISNGFDVLQIRPGHIQLPGYDTGFIGGCCGLIAPDCLAVCGDLHSHPDGECIFGFLKKYHVSVLKLMDGILQDIGGIIPLKQYK